MGQKIVIADDETYIRVLLRQTLEELEDAGVALRMARDGLEAWEAIRAERPDLVILDMMMPGLSGYEVGQRIKADPDLRHTYVMMLTARGEEVNPRECAEMGIHEYLTKPFDPDCIAERVADVLGVKR